MKNGTKAIIRIIISIIYIVWAILSPITAIKAIFALDLGGLATAAVSVLMLLAGIFGLLGIKKDKCRLFGVVVFIASVVAVVLSIVGGGVGLIQNIITALLAWLFIACLR